MVKKSLFLISYFIVGFSLMVVELTSTRILAVYVGVSIYTLTAVIGIILLGLAIGSYLGGRLIDRYYSPKTIFIFFTSSALLVAFIPVLSSQSPIFVSLDLPLMIIVVLISLVLFFLPAIFIGTLYPSLLKFYLDNIAMVGKKSGTLSMVGATGSIVGTFSTGFFFLGYLSSSATIFIISIILFINGLFFYRPKIKILIVLFSLLIAIFFLFQLIHQDDNSVFKKESNYYTIRVVDTIHDVFGRIRILFLDFDSHSVEGLDGQDLDAYPEIYPVFSVLNSNIKNILNLGGGSYSISKKFADFYIDSKITVVEIDPLVSETAEKFFNLKSYPIKTNISDGRIFLTKNNEKYDLIFSDVYNSFISVPWHLTTNEFNNLVKSHLNEGGIYAVNFLSALQGENSTFFQSMLSTFKKTFDNYEIFAFGFSPFEPQNIILVGINSSNQINSSDLKERIRSLKNGEFLLSKLVLEKPSENNALVLTDDFAPVEKLMTPLINNYFPFYAEFYYSFL